MKGITQAFYGTTEEWENNPDPLYKGVFGIEVRADGRRITKVGDGETLWPLLPTIGQENIDDEANIRAAADAQLQDDLDAEAQTRETTDAQLQAGLDAESQTRAETDTQLQDNIDAEAQTREDADITLQDNIDDEMATRASADGVLQQNISDGDATLQQNINAEAQARAAADNGKIDKAAAGAPGTLMQSVTIREDTTNSVIVRGWSRNVNTPGDAIPTDVALPMASEDRAGVMPAESFAQIEENAVRIEALEGRALHYSIALPSDSPTQEELQAAYENASGEVGEAPDQVTLDDTAYNKSYTWYETSSLWVDRGASTITPFTNSSHGTIKGSNTAGKVFAENDGTGSVVGWDSTQAAISNMETKLEGIEDGAQVNPGEATESAAGLMSAEDKAKLDNTHDGYPPIGFQYVQHASAASNSFDVAFPSNRRPENLWPGTKWNKLWEDEEVFFRTGGSLGDGSSRIDGLQDDQSELPNHSHSLPSHSHSLPSHSHSFSYSALNTGAGSVAPGTVGFTGITGSTTKSGTTGGTSGTSGSTSGTSGSAIASVETRPKNRFMIIWERYE